MEEILIKSKPDEDVKKLFLYVWIAFFVLAVFFLILQFAVWGADDNKYIWIGYSRYYAGEDKFIQYAGTSGYKIYYDKGFWEIPCIYIALSCALFGAITLKLYQLFLKSEMVVSNMNVKGRTFWGQEVSLPLYMISSYSMSAKLSSISVATSSGTTGFSFISNYKEIGEVLNRLLNDRQMGIVSAPTPAPVAASAPISTSVPTPARSQWTGGNYMEELKGLKELFDAGVITQEEFEAKKKQVLGL